MDLELLHFKNRQKKTSNLVFMENQPLTKVIQIFPPKHSNRKKIGRGDLLKKILYNFDAHQK